MKSDILDEEINEMMLPNGEVRFQKPQNEHQKPFMASTIHKTVPIGYQFHQIEVPDYIGLTTNPRQHISPPRSTPLYLHNKIQEEQLEAYLSFVESYYQQKIPDYFSQGVNSRDVARRQAMELLHTMDYNYTKAKFYLVFPYYLTYNRYRRNQPLSLSNAEMNHRISEHLQGLKSTKEKQLERWIGTIQNSIESRIHLSKLNTLIEVAKQNKFQIPQAIRQHVQRSLKMGKQIKKTLHSTKLPLEKLILKKQSLVQCKIITNEMIQFEQTVTRCQEWLKKQQFFEEAYFIIGNQITLKKLSQKIQFRALQLLVNEFNNLPLVYENFQKTTGVLYSNTMSILQRLPSFTKSAKTRTSQNSLTAAKVSIECIREFLLEIQGCPVSHEDFIAFENTIRQNLQWLQRIGLWLEDQRSEKTFKLFSQYIKIINDIPIANKIQAKLQSRLEYYQIMDKVKKDISNPAKYQQIKDAIKKLKEKGCETFQYNKLQSKIVSYMQWYQSQQILNENRLPATKIELFTNQKNIKLKMIPEEAFRLQLISARQELNIPQQVWVQSQGKMQVVQHLKMQIRQVLTEQNPNLYQMIDFVRQSIKNGLLFQQFQILYNRMIDIYFVTAKMEFMLMAAQENPGEGEEYFFNSQDLQYVFGIMNQLVGFEVKFLQTKEAGDQVLLNSHSAGFPKHLPAFRMFQSFMQRAQRWSVKAQQMIHAFKDQVVNDVNIKQLIDQSKNCLHSKSVQQQLNRIDTILKWRQKISKKLNEHHESPFSHEDNLFFQGLVWQLQEAELNVENSQRTKMKALQFLNKNGRRFKQLLQKISNTPVEFVYKLSQMNKFCKEIDKQIQKYRLQDKTIFALKESLQRQLALSDQWKQKYLSIKRFQKKKNKKDQEDQERKIEENQQRIHKIQTNIEGLQMIPYIPTILNESVDGKRKYFIRNGQFCWFYKLPLMILEAYNGFNLKFVTEDLVRLKNTLAELSRFLAHYSKIMQKPDKTDYQLQSLQNETSKFAFFFKESYVLNKKNRLINSWKQMANAILRTVPIFTLQLKARKPQEILQLLQMQKNPKEEVRMQGQAQQLSTKRKRKQNPFYSNEDMTLITEQTFGVKAKKKRKGNVDSEYRNTAVSTTVKKLARNQREQIQRAEALLSGQLPAELIHIDDPKQYCICRFGVPNEDTTMVQCEYKCEQWFHIECLGIKKNQTKTDFTLKCVGCRSLYSQQSMDSFIWHRHAKMTEYAFEEVVTEGRQFGVQTSEMKKLQTIYNKMVQWKAAVKDMLKKVCQTNGQDLPALEPPLYQLFLQSLWFPSCHPEAQIVRKLVLLSRNEL